jgi:hypothetical protein
MLYVQRTLKGHCHEKSVSNKYMGGGGALCLQDEPLIYFKRNLVVRLKATIYKKIFLSM